MHVRRWLAAAPALKEVTGNPIAYFKLRPARADLDHLAGVVRQRDDVLTHRYAIAAARNAKITKIKRASFHLDKNLAIGRLGIGMLDFDQSIDAGAALWQLVRSHVVLGIATATDSFFLEGAAGAVVRAETG